MSGLTAKDVDEARARWIAASRRASELSAELFQPGSGYGHPDALAADQHKLQSFKDEADRLFQDYEALARRLNDEKTYSLQRSQTLSSWASFSVAFVVAIATIWTMLRSTPN